MQLLSGSVVQDLLTRKDNRLDAWIEDNESNSELVEELFWSTVSRAPTDAETARISDHFEKAKDRRSAVEDVMWALVNSKEFLFRR